MVSSCHSCHLLPHLSKSSSRFVNTPPSGGVNLAVLDLAVLAVTGSAGAVLSVTAPSDATDKSAGGCSIHHSEKKKNVRDVVRYFIIFHKSGYLGIRIWQYLNTLR